MQSVKNFESSLLHNQLYSDFNIPCSNAICRGGEGIKKHSMPVSQTMSSIHQDLSIIDPLRILLDEQPCIRYGINTMLQDSIKFFMTIVLNAFCPRLESVTFEV